MKVRVCTLGPRDMGAMAEVVQVDQSFDLPASDSPHIEITLDNGAVILLEPTDEHILSVTNSSLAGTYIAPRAGNKFDIVIT